jgi:hypothetical protein
MRVQPAESETQMADARNTSMEHNAEAAGRRAAEARDRAEQLAAHLDAVRRGTERLRGSSEAELAHAAQRADRAHERLRMALIASADAHDRAGNALEEEARRHGDADGTRTARAAAHRQGAVVDRRLAETDATDATGSTGATGAPGTGRPGRSPNEARPALDQYERFSSSRRPASP